MLKKTGVEPDLNAKKQETSNLGK